jgi:hypothetical protein
MITKGHNIMIMNDNGPLKSILMVIHLQQSSVVYEHFVSGSLQHILYFKTICPKQPPVLWDHSVNSSLQHILY